ncbi:hypothetical protein, partial [Albidovulum sp.]
KMMPPLLLALACAGPAVAPAQATTLDIVDDGGWTWLHALAAGSERAGGGFAVTLDRAAYLTVVDRAGRGAAGGGLTILADGQPLGGATAPAQGLGGWGQEFDAALADGRLFMGRFLLDPGTHVLTIAGLDRAGRRAGDLVGAFRLEPAAVPIPAAGAMLLSGLALAAFARRRST